MVYSENGQFDNGIIAYDARQRRVKIICDQMEECFQSCKAKNYYEWFRDIEDFYSVSRHIYESDEIDKTFTDLKSQISDYACDHQEAWINGETANPEEEEKMHNLLRQMFELIMQSLEDKSFWGTKFQDDGDDF